MSRDASILILKNSRKNKWYLIRLFSQFRSSDEFPNECEATIEYKRNGGWRDSASQIQPSVHWDHLCHVPALHHRDHLVNQIHVYVYMCALFLSVQPWGLLLLMLATLFLTFIHKKNQIWFSSKIKARDSNFSIGTK